MKLSQDTNRFTILLNHMRLMGVFDWWCSVLDFISKNPEDPNNPNCGYGDRSNEEEGGRAKNADQDTKFFMQEEPLYPSAGRLILYVQLISSFESPNLRGRC